MGGDLPPDWRTTMDKKNTLALTSEEISVLKDVLCDALDNECGGDRYDTILAIMGKLSDQ